MSTRPEGLYLRMTWPFTSTPHTLPSASTRMPCEDFTVPSPQDWSMLPLRSNSITGCGPRLKTQTLSCRSTATPEHSPKFHPAGSWAQSLTTWYGRDGPDFSSAASGQEAARATTTASAHFMWGRLLQAPTNVKSGRRAAGGCDTVRRVTTRKISLHCPVCGSAEVVYSCTPACCFNHVCSDCGATFEPATRATGGTLWGAKPPEPLPDASDPTVGCAKCESTAVYTTDDGRVVCTACGSLLEVEYTEVAPSQ